MLKYYFDSVFVILASMQKEPDSLPNDIDKLKQLVLEQVALNQKLSLENTQYKTQVLSLKEQLNLAIARRCAASSEKISPDQVKLFDEAEFALSLVDADDNVSDDTVVIAGHIRKKSGRKNPYLKPYLD